ncbi:MAG: carbon storage regulator [Actinomycetes bacterium]
MGRSTQTRLGIDAPRTVEIARSEILADDVS